MFKTIKDMKYRIDNLINMQRLSNSRISDIEDKLAEILHENVNGKVRVSMFTYEELARLNAMIGIALLSGKVEFDKISESIHQKVTNAIQKAAQGDAEE